MTRREYLSKFGDNGKTLHIDSFLLLIWIFL